MSEVLGATGMVGQQFIALLAQHPWFDVELAGRERAVGGQGVRRRRAVAPGRRRCPTGCRDAARRRLRRPAAARSSSSPPSTPRRPTRSKPQFAAAGHVVVSNARNYRMDPLVPLLIPEVNADHLDLLPEQQTPAGWKGAIVTNPNCATVVLAMALAPLRQFDIRRVSVTTLQAVSGAGYPGVPSLDILGNVIPYIGGGEEEKIENETQQDSRHRRRAQPTRRDRERAGQPRAGDDGHTMTVSVELGARPHGGRGDGRAAGVPRPAAGPGAADRAGRPIVVMDEPDRPQPRLDADRGGGMAVSVGRVRAVSGAHAQVRRARPQHDPRRGRRGDPERRADAGRGTACDRHEVRRHVGRRSRRDRAPDRHRARRAAGGHPAGESGLARPVVVVSALAARPIGCWAWRPRPARATSRARANTSARSRPRHLDVAGVISDAG